MNAKKSIFLFILATFILSAGLIMTQHSIAVIAEFAPALVALALIFTAKNRKAAMAEAGFLQAGEIKWYELAVILPMLAIISSYLIGTLLGFFAMDFRLPWLVLTYRTVVLTLMWPLIWALGQEIGWRGYLQPKLVALMGVRRGDCLHRRVMGTLVGNGYFCGQVFFDWRVCCECNIGSGIANGNRNFYVSCLGLDTPCRPKRMAMRYFLFSFYCHAAISVALAVVCLYYFGGLVLNLFPVSIKSSWEAHVFGFLAGLAAAYVCQLPAVVPYLVVAQ